MRTVSVVLFLAACSEYDLVSPNGTGLGSGSTPGGSTTGATEPACGVDPLPGFDAPSNDECWSEPTVGTFSPVVEWGVSHFPGPPGDQVMSAPIVIEVNGDGVPDIVFVSYDTATYYDGGILRAIDGATGTQHWAASGAGLQGTGGVAGGDLDGDGAVDLVSLTPSGAVAFDDTGAVKWRNDALFGAFAGTSDVPAISDMDHDGRPEVIAGRAILNGEDGTEQGRGAFGYGGVSNYNVGSCPFAADVDADGIEEVVTGNALYRPDGSAIWAVAEDDGYPAVADFDGDGQAEIVVSGQGELRMFDTDGTPLLRVPIPGAGTAGYGGPPTIADFDGDGEPEIGLAAGSRYSVLEADGTILWQAMTDDSSSGNTGSAVFDFEGDGSAEVVYGDQTRLWVFSGLDGSVRLESAAHSNGTWLEYAVIVDVDGDDHAEIVVPNEEQWGGKTGIVVLGDLDDSWQPGRRIWNQHAYSITNVNDDGTIPTTAGLNWLTYNNFRSGDLSTPDGLLSPDLVPSTDTCTIDCRDGRLVLHVHPGNEGLSDVLVAQRPWVDVAAVVDGRETPVGHEDLATDLAAGDYLDSVVFDLVGMDFAAWDEIVVRVGSDAPECLPENNELRLDGPFCQD